MNDEHLSESQKTRFTSFNSSRFIIDESGQRVEIPPTPVTAESTFYYSIKPDLYRRHNFVCGCCPIQSGQASSKLAVGNETPIAHSIQNSNYNSNWNSYTHYITGTRGSPSPWNCLDPLYYYPKPKKFRWFRRIFNIK